MTENITVNPSELHDCIMYALRANHACMIVGAPGCGKSEIAMQAIKSWEPNAIVRMIPGVSLLPTDPKGLGMPNADRTAAQWLLYDWALELLDATGPYVLNIEDIGQASQMAQASLMPIIQARMIGGQRISDYVRFVFTTNRREDKAGVTGVIEPLKNRCLIFELETTIQDWVRYYAVPNGLPIPVISFYRTFPRHLQNFQPSADITNSPTARQAKTVADIYQLQPPRSLWSALYSAAIGQPAMLDLVAFLDLYGQLPDPQEIIMYPDSAPLPDATKPSYRYATVGALVNHTTVANIDRVMTYLARLQDLELEAFFIECTCSDKPGQGRNPMRDTRAYVDWITKNGWMYQ